MHEFVYCDSKEEEKQPKKFGAHKQQANADKNLRNESERNEKNVAAGNSVNTTIT